MVNNEDELVAALRLILADSSQAQKAGGMAFQVIEENRGAVDRAMDLISETLRVTGYGLRVTS
jgi:3-deoxy-D-manno-octulosonic-acid transferase